MLKGRMTSAAGVNYTYDADNRRVKKSNGKLYWYGIGGEVLAESDLTGAITAEYIYFNGQRIARKAPSSSTVYYYVADRLGTARVIVSVNINGTVNTPAIVAESDNYPYGGERVVTADTTNNTYKFTGHERDGETGLDHTLYRQYSSNTGRWLSADSHRGKVRKPQSWNRYAYVSNSPCSAIDPDGREEIRPFGCTYNPETGAWNCSDPFGLIALGGGRPPIPENSAPMVTPEDIATAKLGEAAGRAKKALGTGECGKLFNTSGNGMDPVKVLDDMVTNATKHGGVGFTSDRSVVANDAVTVGDPSTVDSSTNLYGRVNIWINSSSEFSKYWNGSDATDNDRGRMLIHELGHVFNMLQGAGGSAFKFETGNAADRAAAESYNADLEKKCISDN